MTVDSEEELKNEFSEYTIIITSENKMETCVLIPPEFALGYSKDAKFSVLSTRSLKPGMLFHPFQGNIRIDKLAVPRYVNDDDVSKSRSAETNYKIPPRDSRGE